MEASTSNRYTPPVSFKPLDEAPPLLDDAFLKDKELWLIQMPTNQLTPEDLSNKRWNMHLLAKNGVCGQFFSSQGDEIIVLKEDFAMNNSNYAFFPTTGGSFSVRKITCQASFTQWPEIEASEGAAVSQEQGMTTPQSTDLIGRSPSRQEGSRSTISQRKDNQESVKRHSSNHLQFTDYQDTLLDRSNKIGEVSSSEAKQFTKGYQEGIQISECIPHMQKPSGEELKQEPHTLLNMKSLPAVNQDTIHKSKGTATAHREHSHKKKRKHQENLQGSDGLTGMQKPSMKESRGTPSNFDHL